MNKKQNYQLAFIGAGYMAEAIIKAVLAAKIFAAEQILVCEPAAARRDFFSALGLSIAAENSAAQSAPVLILAIKPQQLELVLPELAAVGTPDKLLISILAGVKTEKLERQMRARVVRVMPNLPLTCGAGMSAITRGKTATADDEALALKIFRAGGQAIALAEKHFDAVTALSGSGPAYYFLLTKLLALAAMKLELPEEIAEALARQTAIGAAEILRTTDLSPTEWQERVTSKGGTTAAAVECFNKNNLAAIVTQAINAAAIRSAELGQ